VNAAIGKLDSDGDLTKSLHSLLFGTAGKHSTRKRDIRRFNGFPSGTVRG
jgi:hypothetical protein